MTKVRGFHDPYMHGYTSIARLLMLTGTERHQLPGSMLAQEM